MNNFREASSHLFKNTSISQSLNGIYRLLIIVFTLLTIYFAQTILIPITVAALLSFLLSPLVVKLEKWVGRLVAILIVVTIVFSIIGFLCYIFAKQFVLFGSNFQGYYEIIQAKIHAIQSFYGEVLNKIEHALGSIKEALLGQSPAMGNLSKVTLPDFKLSDLSANFISFFESFFGSFFNILWMTAIVILLVFFMLFNREDIKNRIIKLMGESRISATTSAMNDASDRVFQYLVRFFIVNVGFGMIVMVGLYFIGIPNAVLWGCFAAVLRFVPYIGSSIAAAIPIILSFIITNDWSVPLLTIAFFIVLEVVTAYVLEPFYYGIGTGVSSFALILAALFWTWVWGPIGLLLSTPLTVCLVVLGHYVTNMNFLRVLLSQEKALTPVEECYHRLLSVNSTESMDLMESYLKKNSLVSLYDSLLIPVTVQAEKDFQLELIDFDQKEDLNQSVREIVEFLTIKEQREPVIKEKLKENILCLPGSAPRDEIGANILAGLLARESFQSHYTSRLNINEMFEMVEKINPDAICITALAPFVPSKTLYLLAKLHQKKPDLPIIVCLLGFFDVDPQINDKLSAAGATHIVLTLEDALHTLQGQ